MLLHIVLLCITQYSYSDYLSVVDSDWDALLVSLYQYMVDIMLMVVQVILCKDLCWTFKYSNRLLADGLIDGIEELLLRRARMKIIVAHLSR